MTAKSYLSALKSGRRSGVGSQMLKEIKAKIRTDPSVQSRLAFQFMALAKQQLEADMDFSEAMINSLIFSGSITGLNRFIYVTALERIIIRSFKRRLDRVDDPYHQTLCKLAVLQLTTLRKLDKERFSSAVARLKPVAMLDPHDCRRELLRAAEETLASKRYRLRQIMRNLRLDEQERLQVLRSYHN